MKRLVLYSILSFTAFSISAQSPVIQWEKSIGGTSDDYGFFIDTTSDGGYITVGTTASADGLVPANFGIADMLLSKLDSLGNVEWVKNLGGSNLEEGYSVYQTVDGGYFITGYTRSNDVNVASNYGLKDIWVVKTSGLGIIQWENTYGGTNDERAYYSTQTADGGYILAGYTESNNNDVTFNNGAADVWIVKMDSAGTLQWQKSYGGTGFDYGYHISETPDGGYIITANSDSNDGDVTGYHGGTSDVWIIKVNNIGTIEWEQCYGGSSLEYGTTAYSTSDGGYIFSAYTSSNDMDITFTHGDFESWVVKLNAIGIIQWDKCFGGSISDANYTMRKTLDGKYILAGYSYSSDGDVIGQHPGGEADFWIVKMDTAGTLEWQKCVGGNGNDQAFYITQTADSSYTAIGLSNSSNADVSFNYGLDDWWVVKLIPPQIVTSNNSVIAKTTSLEVSVFPNPSNGEFYFKNLEIGDRLEVYDVSGKCVLNALSTSSTQKINLGEKEKGIYFYRITGSNEVSVGKLILK